MILIAILLCVISSYIIIEKQLTIQNILLKGILSLCFTISFLSLCFTCFLFAKISFNVFQITFIIIPLTFILMHLESVRIKMINIKFPPYLIFIIILLCLIIFSYLFFKSSLRWGDWDAWAIWILHAKFLTYDTEFINLFTNKIAWTHPDYPLMLPSIIAMVWKSFGNYSPVVPMMICYITAVSLILVILTSFYEKNYKITGVIVLIILTCSSVLFPYIHTQYSDTLLGVYMLIPFILLNHLSKEKPLTYILLIGFFTASCSWIKNEGLIFFFIFFFYFLLRNFKKIKYIKYFVIGAIMPLVVLIIFKLYYAPSNDLIAGQSTNTFYKLIDVQRYLTIIWFFVSYIFLNYKIFYFLLILILLVDYKYYGSFSFRVIFTLIVVYIFVYVITPYDLIWHLTTSFKRLLYQMLPTLIYTVFIKVSEKTNCCNGLIPTRYLFKE